MELSKEKQKEIDEIVGRVLDGKFDDLLKCIAQYDVGMWAAFWGSYIQQSKQRKNVDKRRPD